jgi:hypothetical protein
MNKSMYVSKINLIADRLNFLGQSIASEGDADGALIYIKCEKANKKLEVPNKIKFYIDLGIYAEVTTVDKYNGEVLDKEIAVNLYDLYNIVNNCDDVVSFELDTKNSKLVISSYYNETTDYDELEMQIPYTEVNFPSSNVSKLGNKIVEFELDAKSCYSIIKELSIGNNQGFNFIVKDNKFSIESYNKNYPYLKTRLFLKDMLEVKSPDFASFVPFSLFKLISGSGELGGLDIEVHENGIKVNTDNYKFFHITTGHLPIIKEDSSNYIQSLIVDIEAFYHNLRILNAINLPNKNDTISLEKVDDTTADLMIENQNRYTGSTRIKMAMFSDTKLIFSGKLFYEIFERLGIDAIALKFQKPENEQGTAYKLYSKIENFMIIKEFFYDHMEYLNK